MKTKIATMLILSILFLTVTAVADGTPERVIQQQETEYLGPPDVDHPHDIHYDRPPWWMVIGNILPDQ